MAREPLIVAFEDADPTQVELLGAKGAKLVEDMRHIRVVFQGMEDLIAVPDGFILSTEVWRHYHQSGNKLTEQICERIVEQMRRLQERKGRRFGDRSGRMPLVVAVRGGAPVSLPGALSTVLNVGLNDDVVNALIEAGEEESFVRTTYLTAIRMYGEVVLGIPYDPFYDAIVRARAGNEGSIAIPLLKDLLRRFNDVLGLSRHPSLPHVFEQDLNRQLRNAIEAILSSWMSPTAMEARRSRKPKVSDDMGSAVVIQEMVFGNRDEQNCLSGVLFTRNQRTGSNELIIEWAPKVQCDKIVSGRLRKPLRHTADLQRGFPDIHERLLTLRERFEGHSKRPLDVEFTVEGRKLYVLQRRPLRMTSNATVRAMWDLVDEGKTNIQQASMIINTALEQPEKVLREDFRDYVVLARGEPITDSADSGILAFGTESALELALAGEEVILLRRRPYGENDVAVNHPLVRGIVRCDGNTTGHEAVSAVAYSKPYLINLVDADGNQLLTASNDEITLNPDSLLAPYLGRRVFVDGERGILCFTTAGDFLEDRKGKKKLYVDWEYLRYQFDEAGYHECDYDTLLDLHYQWELELESYQSMERALRKDSAVLGEKELLQAFATCLRYIPPRDRKRALRLKDVRVEDFVFEPQLQYKGIRLGSEVLKVLKMLMLCTTWCTHWLHELMVVQAKERGDTENDVIRDIFLKNRTMSLMRDFEEEGFHVMRMPDCYHLILASNFEYGQDLDKVDIGPATLNYTEKEILARQFMVYLQLNNPSLHDKVRMVQGEPPFGQGHARIISIGISVPHAEFDLLSRYLRTFLDRTKEEKSRGSGHNIPVGEFTELYHVDPFFAPFPDLEISLERVGTETTGDCLIIFGRCSFGEFNGTLYGKDEYEGLMAEVSRFQDYLTAAGKPVGVRPWHFEVDPYRRHSVIAAAGMRFEQSSLPEVLQDLKAYLSQKGACRK
ncbi:MAG: PEP/pyruvate-binding domain-containing protein [Syntrophobacteraceae bacterium]